MRTRSVQTYAARDCHPHEGISEQSHCSHTKWRQGTALLCDGAEAFTQAAKHPRDSTRARTDQRHCWVSTLETNRSCANGGLTCRSDRDALDRLLTSKRIGAYSGIDPTAPSLHLGHLLPLMVLFWLHAHGHHTTSLV